LICIKEFVSVGPHRGDDDASADLRQAQAAAIARAPAEFAK
jgi:hypothetical protein